MNHLIKTGCLFYCIGMAGMGAQQIYYADFRPVFIPPIMVSVPGRGLFVYLSSILLILACVSIVLNIKAKKAALVLGGVFLVLLFTTHIPYEIIIDPYSNHLGTWTNAFKELAFSGGAFVMAGTFTYEKGIIPHNPVFNALEKMIPYGKIFFSVTIITFGICHFLYVEFVTKLVPAWIEYPVFWTYFAGIALIASGIAIIVDFQRRTVVTLLSSMLFIWFIILHIPRAIASPAIDKGNELTSVFQALAFSGIALLIAIGNFNEKQRGHPSEFDS